MPVIGFNPRWLNASKSGGACFHAIDVHISLCKIFLLLYVCLCVVMLIRCCIKCHWATLHHSASFIALPVRLTELSRVWLTKFIPFLFCNFVCEYYRLLRLCIHVCCWFFFSVSIDFTDSFVCCFCFLLFHLCFSNSLLLHILHQIG